MSKYKKYITGPVRAFRPKRTFIKDSDAGLSDMKLVGESEYFDSNYYLSKYPDVRLSGIDPLDHYMKHGWIEGRDPSAQFNAAYYRNASSRFNSGQVNPLVDFLKHDVNGNKSYAESEYDAFVRGVIVDYIEDVYASFVHDTHVSDSVLVMVSMPWEGSLRQRPHHIAQLLAKSGATTVAYIDASTTHPRKIARNLYVFPNIHHLEVISNQDLSQRLFWLFSTQSMTATELKSFALKGYRIIYDYIDAIDQAISTDKNIRSQISNYNNLGTLDPLLLIASARSLKSELHRHLPKTPILLCQNAVDTDHFNPDNKDLRIPNDMKEIFSRGKPIVGYYGAIATWLDFSLINEVAKRRQDLEFVFIGQDFNGALSKLETGGNLTFLGPKDYLALPSYSKYFNCAIIPFEHGDIAKSTSPVKLFEYMAMGIPTVCTSDLKECEGYEYVYLSADDKEFEKNIDKAINDSRYDNRRKKLIEQAAANTWASRVDQVVKALKS